MSKVLKIGLLSEVQNLNPLRAQDFVSAMVVSQIYETPYATPTAGKKPHPVLFGEPLSSEGGEAGRPVYSAPLRPGVTFSDGTPLTTELAAESLRRPVPLAEQAEVEARGDRVVFRLKQPNPRFDLFLTQNFCGVFLEKEGRRLGTGPYLAAPDATPQVMRLVTNPSYRDRPDIDELVFTFYPPAEDGAPERLLAAFERGEVDFCNVLHREYVGKLREVRKHFVPGNSTALLYFNSERPAFADPALRRAVATSIDRLEVASISYTNALAFAARGLLPPSMSGWRDGLRASSTRARSLLEEAATKPPERARMLLMFGPRPYLPRPRQTARFIAERLGELGIEVSIHQPPGSQEYYREVAAGDYDLALAGWIADTLDPADFLEATLSPEAIPSPDQPISIHANLSRWRDPAAVEGLRRFRQDPSEENETALLGRVRDQMPLYPLMYGSTIYVHSWRLKGFEPPPLGIPAFHRLRLSD